MISLICYDVRSSYLVGFYNDVVSLTAMDVEVIRHIWNNGRIVSADNGEVMTV